MSLCMPVQPLAPASYASSYIDFLRNRSFRHSLLCHAEVPLSQQIDMQALSHYYVASDAAIDERGDLLGAGVEKFTAADSTSISA